MYNTTTDILEDLLNLSESIYRIQQFGTSYMNISVVKSINKLRYPIQEKYEFIYFGIFDLINV